MGDYLPLHPRFVDDSTFFESDRVPLFASPLILRAILKRTVVDQKKHNTYLEQPTLQSSMALILFSDFLRLIKGLPHGREEASDFPQHES